MIEIAETGIRTTAQLQDDTINSKTLGRSSRAFWRGACAGHPCASCRPLAGQESPSCLCASISGACQILGYDPQHNTITLRSRDAGEKWGWAIVHFLTFSPPRLLGNMPTRPTSFPRDSGSSSAQPVVHQRGHPPLLVCETELWLVIRTLMLVHRWPARVSILTPLLALVSSYTMRG